jgi:hypothetical protein
VRRERVRGGSPLVLMKTSRNGRENRVGVPLVEPKPRFNATGMGWLWTFSYLKRRWGKEVHLSGPIFEAFLFTHLSL